MCEVTTIETSTWRLCHPPSEYRTPAARHGEQMPWAWKTNKVHCKSQSNSKLTGIYYIMQPIKYSMP